jgi:hypothetical protein
MRWAVMALNGDGKGARDEKKKRKKKNKRETTPHKSQ